MPKSRIHAKWLLPWIDTKICEKVPPKIVVWDGTLSSVLGSAMLAPREQNYGKELDANRAIYVSQVDAALLIRNAGVETAILRQAAAVIAAVGREI